MIVETFWIFGFHYLHIYNNAQIMVMLSKYLLYGWMNVVESGREGERETGTL